MVLKEGGTSDDQRITYAYRRRAVASPTSAERAEIKGLLARQAEAHRRGLGESVRNSAAETNCPRSPPGTTPAQLAAYAAVSRVLLNLDEAITKE
jgi:hypothetical protein